MINGAVNNNLGSTALLATQNPCFVSEEGMGACPFRQATQNHGTAYARFTLCEPLAFCRWRGEDCTPLLWRFQNVSVEELTGVFCIGIMKYVVFAMNPRPKVSTCCIGLMK